MNMVMKTYFEKCLPPEKAGEWGKVQKGEYECKHTVTFPNFGGHDSVEGFEVGFLRQGGKKVAENTYQINQGNGYGINSYLEITFEEVPEKKPLQYNVMPRVNGKTYRCLDCGANVFSLLEIMNEKERVYSCNSCGSQFIGVIHGS